MKKQPQNVSFLSIQRKHAQPLIVDLALCLWQVRSHWVPARQPAYQVLLSADQNRQIFGENTASVPKKQSQNTDPVSMHVTVSNWEISSGLILINHYHWASELNGCIADEVPIKYIVNIFYQHRRQKIADKLQWYFMELKHIMIEWYLCWIETIRGRTYFWRPLSELSSTMA